MYVTFYFFFHRIGPLKWRKQNQDYVYEFNFQAAANEKFTIIPESSFVLFTPANMTIHGTNDCMKLSEHINAKLGVRFEGSVQPALENVKISILNDMDEVVASMLTDITGKYKFVPLQSDHRYRFLEKIDLNGEVLSLSLIHISEPTRPY